MADERTRYFRRLSRRRRSARRWSVIAGGLGGAAAVLTPYAGLGLPDAAWAAGAGGAIVLAAWRWADLRALAAQPAPPALDPAEAAAHSRARLVSAVERLPAGSGILGEVRRVRSRVALRGTSAAEPWGRLDRAGSTFAGLRGRLTGLAAPAVAEATAADRSLRDLALRVAEVERAIRLAPPETRPPLEQAWTALAGQLHSGVEAYERLVAAAAGYVAENVRSDVPEPAVARLTEATDLLHGVASALAELRGTDPTFVPPEPTGPAHQWAAGAVPHGADRGARPPAGTHPWPPAAPPAGGRPRRRGR